ncbi:MAG: glycosyltransferase family 39 protein [Caldilineaceae bacterium]|nr:glycosyltransferase family 39 protein [Caldilineaceae bacterium]
MSPSQASIVTPPHASGQRAALARLLLISLLLASFALRLHDLTRQNIWWDEARNLDVALRPFGQIATAPELDIHPPVYFWLLHGWLYSLGFQAKTDPAILAFGARLLSVVAAMVATVLLYPLSRRFGTRWIGLATVAAAGFAPFWLAESQEARMYTVGFALLTAAAYFLLRITDTTTQKSNHRSYVAFVICSALALLTHYNAVFILVAWYGWWGIVALSGPQRWSALRTVVGCGLAMSLLVAPVLPIALRQIPDYANPNLGIPALGDYLWQNWQAYLGGYAFTPTIIAGAGTVWLWVSLAILGLSTLLSLRRLGSYLRQATFLWAWLVGGLALYYLAVLDRGAFNVRYSSFITPALYLWLGLALGGGITMPDRAKRGQQWLSLVGVIGIVIGFIPLIQADLTDPRFAREDIASVTAWLKANAGPADLILIDQKYPFGFYYQRYGIDPSQPLTGPEAAPARYLFVDINTLDQQLTTWAGTAEKVFWVQWFESDTDPRHAVRFLLDKYGERIDGKDFRGYSIDWWQLTPPTHFALAPALTPHAVQFGTAVQTVAVSLPIAARTPGTKLPVVLQWQRVPNGQADRPYKARVALYDSRDNRLLQSDERLLNDRHLLPAEWQATDQPLNVYSLLTDEALPSGTYTIRLLVYDAESLEPLTILDAAGNPAGIEVTLGEVQIP